jgi:alkanesulfonate monooxygenase SsuD/methylene tetrahydromethanopterin reductase-like flavin-dependent oxidoreductase (luciferase family)
VDEQEWIDANAARLGRALARPQVRAELLALLGTDDAERRRQRRLAAARAELASMELRWKLAEDEVWES